MAPEEKEESEFPTLELDAGWDDVFQEDKKGAEEDAETNERPTLVPAFDIEAFARENVDSKLTPPVGAARAVGPAASTRSASVPPPPVAAPKAAPAPAAPPGIPTPIAVARAMGAPSGIPTPPAVARAIVPAAFPTNPPPPKVTPHAGVHAVAIPRPQPPRPERVPLSKPLPSSEPFSQRKTPAKGMVTPVNMGNVRPEPRPQDATRGRSERPTTLRVDQETLLALADKVAGAYKPAPKYDDPEPELLPDLDLEADAEPEMLSAGSPTPVPEAPADPPGEAPQLETLAASASGSAASAADASPPTDDPAAEMRDRFALGDYSGALVIAESLLEENPTLGEALEYADSCRAMLIKMYTSRIGPLERVPVVEVQRDQMRWLSIDHRAGFVLSLVDGVSSLEMILDVSGMRALDALRILFELVQQRIISFR